MNKTDQQTIKIVPQFLGLPGLPLLVLLPSAVLVGSITGYVEVWAIVALLLSAASRRVLYKDWTRMVWNRNLAQSILIKGLPDNMLSEVDEIIESGQKVIFRCPSNQLLLNALQNYVRERLGVCKFIAVRDQAITVESEEIKRETVLLSMASRESLQRAINVMQQRGWNPDGNYNQVPGLINTVHTQRMQFN
jgi:type IV secretory pathway protease TraF